MKRTYGKGWLALIAVFALVAAPGAARAWLVDFEQFGNGEIVEGANVGTVLEPVTLTTDVGGSGVAHLGAAIFDTTACAAGPNCGGADPDLLVNLGMALIVQNNAFPTISPPGFFATPDDEEDGGTLTFTFDPIELLSVDLIDMNGNGPGTVTLFDTSLLTRTFSIPLMWTLDIFVDGPDGFQKLDLTSLLPQPGEGGMTATAVEDAGFDPLSVDKLEVFFTGSAGLDNIAAPEPGSFALLGLSLLGLAAFRRKIR